MAFASGALQRRQCSSAAACHRPRCSSSSSRIAARFVRCAASSSSSAAAAGSAAVATAEPAAWVKPGSQLEQLAAMTVLSIDTGDIQTIEKFAATGFITDATTNPLFGGFSERVLRCCHRGRTVGAGVLSGSCQAGCFTQQKRSSSHCCLQQHAAARRLLQPSHIILQALSAMLRHPKSALTRAATLLHTSCMQSPRQQHVAVSQNTRQWWTQQ